MLLSFSQTLKISCQSPQKVMSRNLNVTSKCRSFLQRQNDVICRSILQQNVVNCRSTFQRQNNFSSQSILNQHNVGVLRLISHRQNVVNCRQIVFASSDACQINLESCQVRILNLILFKQQKKVFNCKKILQ
jgi:hypothetical protein